MQVDCESKDDNSNNRGEWNYVKITQIVPDQHKRLRWLGVSMLASGTQDCGFAPDRSRRIFPAGKIHSMPSFGGEVKESVPCPSFGAC
jgi:hypothetical protein